ncbi:ABC-F family ATP-binding cassette domain-containing protein [Halopseudomonas pelagia]|uniref:ABC-F family ATP-binding cassette domain-containing protein n=1 Tax=Halopseudomonas pelagia TaxID=553151 RepID=UPI00039A553A|nr:ABC-F family ATP-binding cassette domain-containing protein [Halopseudomonas pelagia]|tara:strand:+ start:31676 stop:33289 length:1614 start_codon:yes stop_codon:yes gene_type:complete
MTTPYLALESVSCVLPDGRTLFSDLTEHFDQRHTGLVGRNGVGKSLLARMLAGQLQPSSGRCVRFGKVYYLAQHVVHPDGATVASLAGAQPALDALERIEAGSTAVDDFDAVGDAWDIRARLQYELQRHYLGYLDIRQPVATLSGGEAMRVALIGAMLSEADFLILDEPTNHLDGGNRRALIEQLRQWSAGLLVVSHDRALLETMTRIVELSALGLSSYGGNYSCYVQCKATERQAAVRLLEQRKLERKREEQGMREQRERQEHRQARGNRQGKQANQARILLDRQKQRSEASAGKLRQLQAAGREALDQSVRQAYDQVEQEALVTLHAVAAVRAVQRCVAELDRAVLPFVTAATRCISLRLDGQQRLGIIGPNGCGKSTLLKLLAGQLQPLDGSCTMRVESAYLDQQLECLEPTQSILEQLLAVNRSAGEGVLRMRLAQLGLDAQKIVVPSGLLSGGERLKAALACVLYAEKPPGLLLLDEPTNHLDLPSLQALEEMLRSYPGALVVVSHDEVFMEQLGLTSQLIATDQGWEFEPW